MCARTFVCMCVCVRIGHMSRCGPERSLYAVPHLEQIYFIYPFDGAAPPPKFRAFFFFNVSERIVLH